MWGTAVIAAMAVLMGRSSPAFATTDADTANLAIDTVEVLHGNDMMESLRAHLVTPDAMNVVSGTSLGTQASFAISFAEIPWESFREVSEATGETGPEEDVSEVQATRVTYPNGVVESAVAIYNDRSKTMIVSKTMELSVA